MLLFDVVGTEYDHSIQNEYERINARLFGKNKDCALIEVLPQRTKCPVRELAQLLVSNVATQMLLQNMDVQKIELEYCDLRKYEAVSLLGKRKGFKNVKNSVEFASILMLLKWLNTDFQRCWQHALNNDVIDVQYTVTANDGTTQQHRFSIIYLYISRMDIWTRIELDDILRNVNVQSSQATKRQTILSDCLREYFNKNSSWHVWICFRIPTFLQSSTNVVYEMLQTAVGVYNKTHYCEKPAVVDGSNSSSQSSCATAFRSAKKNRQILTNLSKYGSSRITAGIDPNPNPKQEQKSGEDISLGRLSYWYTKIDDLALQVLHCMTEYYMQKMKSNLKKVNRNRDCFPQLITSSFDKYTNRHRHECLKSTDIKELHYHREKFSQAYDTFIKIRQHCMSSSKYYLISAYHSTKKAQIVQAERKLLRVLIKNCHRGLSTNLKEHLYVLGMTTDS